MNLKWELKVSKRAFWYNWRPWPDESQMRIERYIAPWISNSHPLSDESQMRIERH